MIYYDLEELFMKDVRKIVEADKEKYSNIKVIEKELMKMYLQWVTKSNDELDGFTPLEYGKIVEKSGNLYDYVEYMLNTGRDVSDIITDRVVAREDAVDFIKQLLKSDEEAVLKYAFTILFEIGGDELTDVCIDLIAKGEQNPDKIGACYEFLAYDNEDAVEKILNVMYNVSEEAQFIFTDILSNYKNNENIFMWLTTMLYRGENLTDLAEMFGRYGDKKAVNLINSFVLDKDLNYSEFIELRNTVERLGGEFPYEKDFTEDEYYKLITTRNKEKKNDNA